MRFDYRASVVIILVCLIFLVSYNVIKKEDLIDKNCNDYKKSIRLVSDKS